MKYLIVITGPTAIGKTALSISLALHYQCSIISADSRQFYRDMKIGTAVPTPDELQAVPHYLVHNKDIDETYTVGDFEKEAIQTIDKLHSNNNFAILVGGSGLYIDAVLNGIDEFPAIMPEVREMVREKYQHNGIVWLQQELLKLDPTYYEIVEKQNPQRLMRALEVCLGSGKAYSSFLLNNVQKRNFTAIVIGLEAERQELYERINLRVDQMMEQGLLAEATALYPFRDLNALQTVGYRELFEFLDGKCSLETAIDEIKKNTRRFSKRQMTWFRRSDRIKWFNYKVSLPEVISYIDNKVNKPHP